MTIKKILMEILDKVVHLKNKYITVNHLRFITKRANKTIVSRSKPWNQFLKTKTQESKMKYYENLDTKDITDSKK